LKVLNCCGKELGISIDPGLSDLGPFIAVTAVCSLKWCRDDIDQDMLSRVFASAKNLELSSLKDHSMVRPYRRFMWSIGIDPTKVRPSHEALLRRVLSRGEFPRINPVVDVGNVASIEYMVPIGLYNLDLLRPPLVLRRSRAGEVFEPIGGKPRRLTGSEVVLSDQEKILHIFPYRDSRTTMVTPGVGNILIVAAGVPGIAAERVEAAALAARRYIAVAGCGVECAELVTITS